MNNHFFNWIYQHFIYQNTILWNIVLVDFAFFYFSLKLETIKICLFSFVILNKFVIC